MRKYNKCLGDQVQDYKQESKGITVHQIRFNYKLSRNTISIRMHFLISFVALVFISLTTLGSLIFSLAIKSTLKQVPLYFMRP